MIFTVKVAYVMEIVKITKLTKIYRWKCKCQTTHKFSQEIRSKLPSFYVTRYMHGFHCESSL